MEEEKEGSIFILCMFNLCLIKYGRKGNRKAGILLLFIHFQSKFNVVDVESQFICVSVYTENRADVSTPNAVI